MYLCFKFLKAPKDVTLSPQERLNSNLKALKEYIKSTPEDIVAALLNNDNLKHLKNKEKDIIANADNEFLYCLYSLKVLLEISQNVNFNSEAKEDLISEKHKSLIIASLTDVAAVALQENLHKCFYKEKGNIFKKSCKHLTNFNRLNLMIELITPLMVIKELHIGKSLEEVQLWYMAAIFSILIANDLKEFTIEEMEILTNLQSKLQKLWLEFSKKLYYRNLMLLYSVLPAAQKQRIFKEMLLRLWSPGGFVSLLYAMTESQRSEEQSLDEMVANLVAQPNFSVKAQHSLIKQILQFLKASLKNKDLTNLMGAGILSLSKIYNNKEENRDYIKNWLKQEIMPLTKPDLESLEAMEWLNFVELVSLLYHIFCTSSIACLPSDLLIKYLALFLELYGQLESFTNQETLKNHLQSLILKILNNRSKEELQQIIKSLALKSYPEEWSHLAEQIHIKENPLNMQELKLSTVGGEINQNFSLTSLINILKSSTYNLLIYQHFIILLQLIPSLILDTNNSQNLDTNPDLLQSEEDIYNKLLHDFSSKYESKFQILSALETLVQHPPLKNLINDNILELLKVLQEILTNYCTLTSQNLTLTEINSTVLMILLILIKEIIENSQTNLEDLQKNLLKPLKQLEQQIQNENLKYQIGNLIKIMKGEQTFSFNSINNEFEEARKLIEAHESYLQVEGIEKMIKLLQKREANAISNCHILTALALNTLKSPESYTFLNCVRLFVALVNVNESEVLELLADEYLNEAAAMDYRLVIGEAILKTSRELGKFYCFKRKM